MVLRICFIFTMLMILVGCSADEDPPENVAKALFGGKKVKTMKA